MVAGLQFGNQDLNCKRNADKKRNGSCSDYRHIVMSGAMVRRPAGAHFLPIFTIFLLMLPVYNLSQYTKTCIFVNRQLPEYKKVR